MVASYSSLNAWIFSTNASRVKSVRRFFSSFITRLLDHRLCGDAGVIGARHPERFIAPHAGAPDQNILQGVVQRVAQVSVAGTRRAWLRP